MRRIAAALFVLTATAFPAGVEAASRLYPFAGVLVRAEFDSSHTPRRLTMAQGGVAVSLGKIAPSLVVRASAGHAEVEVGVRYSLR